MTDVLRVLAVSAPENERGTLPRDPIYSRDPASLFNAMRIAAIESEKPDSAWSRSNFAGSRKERREKMDLMYSLDDMSAFEEKLRKEKPNVLFIGAMSLSLPGAVEVAKKAREILGNDVLIVLGGRHATETIYKDAPDREFVQLQIPGQDNTPPIKHHAGSPLLLIQQGKIPPVFDMVVAGQGEDIIAKIGDVAEKAANEGNVRNIQPYLSELQTANGDWIAGYIDRFDIKTIQGTGQEINYNGMVSPASLFGVRAAFDVFEGNPTAHVFSDTGMGCVYSCDFCSEARDVVGKPFDMKHAPERLHAQMQQAAKVIQEDYPDKQPTAFVEDSIILGGDPKNLEHFYELMKQNPVNIKFGAQFTVDQVLRQKELITKLKEVGLEYVFVGIETLKPEEVGGMAKDVRRNDEKSWAERIEETLLFLNDNNIKSGASLLFGLGEPHDSRIDLLNHIQEWQKISPHTLRPVSANWAVQHALKGNDAGANYDYAQWGTESNDDRLPYIDMFGEAAMRYNMQGVNPPALEELREVHARVNQLRGTPTIRIERAEIPAGAISDCELNLTQAGFPTVKDYRAAKEGGADSPLYYGGVGTPTDKKLAQHIAELEGGRHGLLTPSGHAAIAFSLGAMLKPKDHVLVVDSATYSTKKYFCDTELVNKGVEVEYYDPKLGDDIRNHIKPNTKAIYMESPGGYTHDIQQVDAITKVAKERGITTIMDNTWSASTYFKPFEHGVDVSVVSLGKYHFGTEATPMGAVITQDKSLRDDIRNTALAWGSRVSPRDATHGFDGLRTLEERLQKQSYTARQVSDYLTTRYEVKAVLDPSLNTFPDHALWKQDFSGANSLIPIELRPDLPTGYRERLLNELAAQGLILTGDGWGGSFSLAVPFDAQKMRHTTTASQEGDCIRLYIGHENPASLKLHIQRAFDRTNAAYKTY